MPASSESRVLRTRSKDTWADVCPHHARDGARRSCWRGEKGAGAGPSQGRGRPTPVPGEPRRKQVGHLRDICHVTGASSVSVSAYICEGRGCYHPS